MGAGVAGLVGAPGARSSAAEMRVIRPSCLIIPARDLIGGPKLMRVIQINAREPRGTGF
jgi:hypothetical protein